MRYDDIHGDLCGCGVGSAYEGLLQAEVQRQASPDSPVFGFALESGQAHPLAGAAILGAVWRRSSWFPEASAGVGVEAVRLPKSTSTFSQSSITGATSETTVPPLGDASPALYARGVAGIGLSITASADLVARLVAHLDSAGIGTDFLAATAGIRLRLP